MGSDSRAGGSRKYRLLALAIQDGIARDSLFFALWDSLFFPNREGNEAWADARTFWSWPPALIGTFSGEGFQVGTDLLGMIEDTRLAPVLKIPH